MESTTANWISVASQMVGVIFVFVTGKLTDTWGIGFVSFLGAALLALTSFPICALSISMPTNVTVQISGIVIVFGSVYGVAGGTIHLFSAELFPTSVRALGLGLSYNVAVAFLSGFGPSICEALIELSDFGPPIFMSLMGLISAVAVLLALLLQRQGLIQLTHKRHTPYFRVFGRELAKEANELATESQKKTMPEVTSRGDEVPQIEKGTSSEVRV
jgi:MFS family permease